MSMDRDPNIYDRDTQSYDRTNQVYDRDGRGSNTLAYLIGGLVIALGLLAFLFYDGGNRDVSTTGSTTAPQTQTLPNTSNDTGNGGALTAPATPTAPSTPASPSTPAQ